MSCSIVLSTDVSCMYIQANVVRRNQIFHFPKKTSNTRARSDYKYFPLAIIRNGAGEQIALHYRELVHMI